MKITAKLRPAVKRHGGKGRQARKHIIPLFPPHAVYVEPYAGALSVLLNKKPAAKEVVNDLDPDLINAWVVLRDRGDEFEARLRTLPYSEPTFR